MSERVGAPQRVRLAILGCGAIGRVHARRVCEDGRGEIACLCDPQAAAAEAVQSEFAPRATIVADWRALLADAAAHALDAVIIASPTPLHYAQACAALAAGLHVLCEKPLAVARQEIVDLVARSRESRRVFAVSYQRRYEPLYVTARRELRERAEEYGRIRTVHLFVCERWKQTIAGTWRDDPAVGSGYFGDAGAHQIDVLEFIAGLAPTKVLARSDRRGRQVEVVTSALAELTGGVPLVAHFVGDAHHWREDIHFHGERADLLLRSSDIATRQGELLRCRDNRIERIVDWAPARSPQAAFFDSIMRGAEVVSPPAASLVTHDWAAAVLESVRAGEEVVLDAR